MHLAVLLDRVVGQVAVSILSALGLAVVLLGAEASQTARVDVHPQRQEARHHLCVCVCGCVGNRVARTGGTGGPTGTGTGVDRYRYGG